MLSEAKHLHEIAVLCGEMLHFVQHDMASQCRSNPSATRCLLQIVRRGVLQPLEERLLIQISREDLGQIMPGILIGVGG